MRQPEGGTTQVVPAGSSSISSRLPFFGMAALSLVIDQVTKAWIIAALHPNESVDLARWLAPILSLTHVQNTGVAFGLFPGLSRLFTILSLVVIIGILSFRRSLPGDALWLHGALGLVSGGALGNLADRVLRGHVVDFIDVNVWPLATWPVFNAADAAIVAGVAVLLVDSLLAEREGTLASA